MSVERMASLCKEWRSSRPRYPDFQRSIELDPLAWKGYYRLGLSYSRLGNHTLAIESFKKAGEVGPEGWVEGLIGWEYFCQGSYYKARALYGNQPRLRLYVESSRGNRDVALEWISILKEADLNKSSAHEGLARAYACIGESDSAMLHLTTLRTPSDAPRGDQSLARIRWLRSHPRFIALLRRIGLHE